MAGEGLSIEEVAEAAQEPVERVQEWADLGLLTAEGEQFGPDAAERAQLISFAVRRGITAKMIARACEVDDVIGRFQDMITGGKPRRTHDVADAARASGLDDATVQRLWVASGLRDQREAFDEDVDMLRMLGFAIDAGMPVDALAQLARVLNDALTRVAEAETRLFHFYVHERLRVEGLAGADLDAATQQVSGPLENLVEPAVLYFHRKAWQRALREDMILHLAEVDTVADDALGRMPVAIVFVDLASFTPMTEVMGDTAAAAVLERFSDLVREAASECDGRVLKQIGDEFMLVFPSGEQALRCGQSIITKAASEQQFPDVRLGAHADIALYREGDYLGTTVNVAARVAAQADRGQFLVTGAIRDALGDDVDLKPVGTRSLKGLSEPVDLYEVPLSRTARPVDPVCGMVIDPDTCTATIDWQGERLYFCSEACRDRFSGDPGRYLAAAHRT